MQTNQVSSNPPNPNLLANQKKWAARTKKIGMLLSEASPRQGYPESLAKTCNLSSDATRPPKWEKGLVNDPEKFDRYLDKLGNRPEPTGLYRCSRKYITGHTSKNLYLKAVTCGKDWCKDCGANKSTAHTRRINAIFPRMKALLEHTNTVQYLIITVPSYLRSYFINKDVLNDFRTYLRRKLKRDDRELGIMRYHWAGEDGTTWKPHINILCNGGYMPKGELLQYRRELSIWLKNYFNLNFYPKTNIYTSYTTDENKLKHWVNYVLRATMKTKPISAAIRATMFNYRNTSIYGKKTDWPRIQKTAEQLEAEAIRGYEIDTDTGEIEKIQWEREWNQEKQRTQPVYTPVERFSFDNLEQISPGFFRKALDFSIVHQEQHQGEPPPDYGPHTAQDLEIRLELSKMFTMSDKAFSLYLRSNRVKCPF